MAEELYLSKEQLPPAKSRCPRCKHLHDIDSSRVQKPKTTDPSKATFEAYLATELGSEQIRLKCPNCGATYETQTNIEVDCPTGTGATGDTTLAARHTGDFSSTKPDFLPDVDWLSLELEVGRCLFEGNRIRAIGECRVQLRCDFDAAHQVVRLIENRASTSDEIRDAINNAAKPLSTVSTASNSESQPSSQPQAAQQSKRTGIGQAVGAGAFAGVVGGLAAHYFGGDRLTFPIFLVISIFLLGGLKGVSKFIALVVFAIVAAGVVHIFSANGLGGSRQISHREELSPADVRRTNGIRLHKLLDDVQQFPALLRLQRAATQTSMAWHRRVVCL